MTVSLLNFLVQPQQHNKLCSNLNSALIFGNKKETLFQSLIVAQTEKPTQCIHTLSLTTFSTLFLTHFGIQCKDLPYFVTENAFIPTRSMESDVYSYGVVLLELTTRKKALDPAFEDQTDIVGWARSMWSNAKDIDPLVDSSLLHSNIINQVVDVLMVAFRCTDQNPRQRPTMRDVIKQLLEANPQMRSIRG